MRQIFGIDFPVRILFENPTVAELAGKAAEAKAPKDVGNLLDDLESLSEEDAERLVVSPTGIQGTLII